MKTINSHIPNFAGFYESVWEHSDMLYDEAYHLDTHSPFDIDGHEIVEVLSEHTDWTDYRNDVCQYVCDEWESALVEHGYITRLTFSGLHSPREYNFRTDSIHCDVTYTDEHLTKLKKLFAEHKEEISKRIRDNYTSYDGFMSYHSNDYDDWVDEWYTCEHKFMVVLMWILELEHDVTLDTYYLYENSDIHISMYIDMVEVEKLLNRYSPSEYKCHQTGVPLNEYNFFDYATIKTANLYKQEMGKVPKVTSFDAIWEEKFPWFDDLDREQQELFYSVDQDFYEAEEIYQQYKKYNYGHTHRPC